MRILFLYTELADYLVTCCKELSLNNDVFIIRYPVNKEAPFKFEFETLNVFDKSDFSFDALCKKVNEINPDKIICSGWIDKDYLKIVKKYFNKIPTVIAFDTQWRGDLKQKMACILSPAFLLKRFSHAWVAGQRQAVYAGKLGFKKENVLQGFYSCDVKLFQQYYFKFREAKSKQFPKRFLFVGRYYEFKGLLNLWEAFIQLQSESPNEWQLCCVGAGTLEPIEHPKIKHFGFVQPSAFENIISQTGVFILPSLYEPYGVVVHEYAGAGFPLICSNTVGAADTFLNENENGFVFQTGNSEHLKHKMKKIIEMTDKELNLMSEKSVANSQKMTPQMWTKNLMSINLK